VIAVSAAIMLSVGWIVAEGSTAQTPSVPAGATAPKKFKATRAIVVDKQTGTRRLPTAEEVDALVVRLSSLTPPPEGLPETSDTNATVRMALPRGSGGLILARPAADGTWETRCVFTLDEGAAFLGLVEVVEQ
jgi:hypothetical protein